MSTPTWIAKSEQELEGFSKVTFQRGKSGNPRGRQIEKPFADALRMELAAAGEDHKALRRIAKSLIAKAAGGDLQAINALADRTDGKPAQQHNVEQAVDAVVQVITGVPQPDDN